MDINKQAVLVRLTISTKGLLGERKDEGASATLAGAYSVIDKDSVAGKKQLISQKAKSVRRVRATAHALRVCMYTYCMPWGGDSWLLPLNVRAKFEKEYNKLAGEHDDAKENYFIDYPSLVRAREYDKELGGLFDASDYPTLAKVKQMFRSDLLYQPIPASGHFIADVTDDMKKALDHATALRVTEACNSLVERVKERLVEYVDTLAKYSGGREGRFNDSLVSNLQDIGVLIKDLNFTHDPAIDKLSTEVARVCRYSAQTLRMYGTNKEVIVAEGKTLLSRLDAYKKLEKDADDTFAQMAEIEL